MYSRGSQSFTFGVSPNWKVAFELPHSSRGGNIYTSGSQPGCRGTLGCREIVAGVPPIFAIHLSFDLFCHLGVPPNIDISDQGCRVPKKVEKHWSTQINPSITNRGKMNNFGPSQIVFFIIEFGCTGFILIHTGTCLQLFGIGYL